MALESNVDSPDPDSGSLSYSGEWAVGVTATLSSPLPAGHKLKITIFYVESTDARATASIGWNEPDGYYGGKYHTGATGFSARSLAVIRPDDDSNWGIGSGGVTLPASAVRKHKAEIVGNSDEHTMHGTGAWDPPSPAVSANSAIYQASGKVTATNGTTGGMDFTIPVDVVTSGKTAWAPSTQAATASNAQAYATATQTFKITKVYLADEGI